MERKKSSSRAAAVDSSSIAVVKAAAWAWYERGSGSDAANATPEHVAMWRRRVGPPRPSRYKLEAARDKFSNESRRKALYDDANLSLLDEYEIRSISRQLDSLIENSKILYDKKKNIILDEDDDDDNDSVTTTTTSTSTSTSTSSRASTMIKRNVKRIIGGFWLRNTAAAVCSGARDGGVVEAAVVATRGPYGTLKLR